MTQKERDELKRLAKIPPHQDNPCMTVSRAVDCRLLGELLDENQRMRELLQSAYEHLEAGHPTTAEEMIESFLAEGR
jgi:hypothetical protein